MIINRSGTTIRTSVSDIRVAGRATQGVKIINIREGDSIASVVVAPKDEDNLVVEGAEAVEGVAPEVVESAPEAVETQQTEATAEE
jgi:DNA gyrase subunit A